MDIREFLCGKWLTHVGLPLPYQVWTIKSVGVDEVGEDEDKSRKVCLTFEESLKPLGCNKTNLRRVAELYGKEAGDWVGKKLLVYRAMTQFGDEDKLCIRVCGPDEVPVETPLDESGKGVKFE